MPAPAAEPAPPKTELQGLQLKATEKTDEVSVPTSYVAKSPEFTAEIAFHFSPWSRLVVCLRYAKR